MPSPITDPPWLRKPASGRGTCGVTRRLEHDHGSRTNSRRRTRIGAIAGGARAAKRSGTAVIGCETPQLFSLLPRARFDRVYEGGPDTICGGAFAPQGKAVVESGGYRASGRWGFASGCQHADWLFGQGGV